MPDVIQEILANIVFREGVRTYQRPRGLVPDGQIGPLTLRQIGEDMREHMTSALRWDDLADLPDGDA